MLNLDQIQVFLVVASHLHFSKAADDLYISQSAVSATIARLESQLGAPLFHRIGRRVELTDAGLFLKQQGALLLEQAKGLERGLQDFSDMQRGCLQLGASFTVANYWLPRQLTRFRNRFPGIAIDCHLANAETILEGTAAGRFDLGFLCGRMPSAAAMVVGEERLVLVVGRGHPWFGQPAVQAQQLLGVDWLIREPGSGARQMLEQSLRDIGVEASTLPILQVLPSSEMVKEMVRGGCGIAALPASMVEQDIALGSLWPMQLQGHSLASEPIWMVRDPHRHHSQLLSSFAEMVLAAHAPSQAL